MILLGVTDPEGLNQEGRAIDNMNAQTAANLVNNLYGAEPNSSDTLSQRYDSYRAGHTFPMMGANIDQNLFIIISGFHSEFRQTEFGIEVPYRLLYDGPNLDPETPETYLIAGLFTIQNGRMILQAPLTDLLIIQNWIKMNPEVRYTIYSGANLSNLIPEDNSSTTTSYLIDGQRVDLQSSITAAKPVKNITSTGSLITRL